MTRAENEDEEKTSALLAWGGLSRRPLFKPSTLPSWIQVCWVAVEDTFKTSRSSSRENFLNLLIPHLVSGNVRDEEMLTHSGYLGPQTWSYWSCRRTISTTRSWSSASPWSPITRNSSSNLFKWGNSIKIQTNENTGIQDNLARSTVINVFKYLRPWGSLYARAY